MAEIRTLYNGDTQVIPRTKTAAVEQDDGTPLDTVLSEKIEAEASTDMDSSAVIRRLKKADGTILYPLTSLDAVKNSSGVTLQTLLNNISTGGESGTKTVEVVIYTESSGTYTAGKTFSEIKASLDSGMVVIAILGTKLLTLNSFSDSLLTYTAVDSSYTVSLLTHSSENVITYTNLSLPVASSETSGIVKLGALEADTSIDVVESSDNIPKVSKTGIDSYLNTFLTEYLPSNTVKVYSSTSEPTASDGKVGDLWVVTG